MPLTAMPLILSITVDLAEVPPETTIGELRARVRTALATAPALPDAPKSPPPEPALDGFQFRKLNAVELRRSQVELLTSGLDPVVCDALHRVAEHGPVFNCRLLAQPGRPKSYAHTHGCITKRLRTITGDGNARLFAWRLPWRAWATRDEETGWWFGDFAVTDATLRALREYFELD